MMITHLQKSIIFLSFSLSKLCTKDARRGMWVLPAPSGRHDWVGWGLDTHLCHHPILFSAVISGNLWDYNEKLFRVRVGDYRILYEVDYKNDQLGIVKLDKRSKVY